MPINYIVSIPYSDIYNDFDTVSIPELISDIPTQNSLIIIAHFTAMIHTQEDNSEYQKNIVIKWSGRFSNETRNRINQSIQKISSQKDADFNLINNISSLLLIECILENHNDLALLHNLTPEQEEKLFKAYLYLSAKWNNEQANGAKKYKDEVDSMLLVMMLPFSELAEFKDFNIQFLKAVYFFKFCEDNPIFKEFLKVFLESKGLETWNEYLFNLLTVYITLLQVDNVKSVLDFSTESSAVFESLEHFCVDVNSFKASPDFLGLRQFPIYKISDTELLFLNVNFLIDKIYQGIAFDFADVLINKGLSYKGKVISNRPQFFGIFGDEFIESGLFYKVVESVFNCNKYRHYSGDNLKSEFEDGVPDYLIIDNCKVYVFEFKNAIINGKVKYSFDIDLIKDELEKKFVVNSSGSPKGVTQLVNFMKDVSIGRYKDILGEDVTKYIIYPILVTTDFSFKLPVMYQILSKRFEEVCKGQKIRREGFEVKELTIIDLDSIIKFQDFFIERKLTLNHVLADYQKFLRKGATIIEQSLSFDKYLHFKTKNSKTEPPKMFMEEVKKNLFA
jgi:hypothetical protein